MNLQFLGAPEDVDIKSWAQYFTGVRDQLKSSLDDMLAAYRTFKKIRESFGLPVVGTSGEARLRAGSLNDSQYQQMLELASMGDIGVKALDDAIANKRKVGYDRAASDFQIERLPSDDIRIEMQNGKPTLISNVTNQPTQIMGQIDGVPRTLGLAPIVWIGLGIAGVIVTVGALYTVNTAMQTATTMVQEKTRETIALKSMELVEKGKATPAEAKQLQTATYEAAADLEAAKGNAAAKTGLTPETNKTIRTVALVALGIGAIYLVSKFVPNRSPQILPA
jgi:hypothetical protein